jgi:hemoglobin
MLSLPIVHRPGTVTDDAPDEATVATVAAAAAPDAVAGPDARPALRDEDLFDLLVTFYDTVARDELLAPYFAPVDMSAHMPRITDFWSTLLFHTGRYTGNAFRPHAAMPGLTARHVAHGIGVLEATVDARFAGDAAERMKALGHRIAYSMQLRLGIPPFADFRPDAG